MTDIEGVLWLSTSTLQLQQVEFRYTGLNLPVSDEHLGGQVEFSRLSTGAWAVTSWRIRMPNILRLGIWRPRLTGIREEGGEVVEIRSGGGEVLFRRDGGS